jgi:hypothetical protein
MKANNQLEEVKIHLMEFGHLTSIEAIREYGITRLSDKIYRLRKEGMNIETLRQEGVNRYGNKYSIAIYKLNQSYN